MSDSIGELLKRLRKSRRLTLRQLAGLARVPQSTLSSVETGTRAGGKLTLETGKRLARALGVSLDVIAGVYDDDVNEEDSPMSYIHRIHFTFEPLGPSPHPLTHTLCRDVVGYQYLTNDPTQITCEICKATYGAAFHQFVARNPEVQTELARLMQQSEHGREA